ncbi:hypothetical protein LCGC14_1116610 [marine sediment metagenome]|uniref:Uncharacterized protein n=1 Tax=marine sediment metagenome TaxID=412755 RepID=A0A0F9MT40_9ZZZZ
MEEIKTPYDEAAQNAALRGDHNEANDFRNMALGYRAALARVVSVEEIEAALMATHRGMAPRGVPPTINALAKAVHALRLGMTRERLVETLEAAEKAWQKKNQTNMWHAPYEVLADAILGGE